MAMAMVLLVVVANLVIAQYVRGATQLAADEGARIGSALGGDSWSCEARAETVLRGSHGLLGGPAGSSVQVNCFLDASDGVEVMVAVGAGLLPGWLPGLEETPFRIETRSVVESPP
ncbi:MAG: hypothetical protein ACE5GC_02060 [Acidimicrobiia bacterium]